MILFNIRARAVGIHGDKSQSERDHVLKRKCPINYAINLIIMFYFISLEFRNGRANILVATDVAARGLGKCLYNYFLSF